MPSVSIVGFEDMPDYGNWILFKMFIQIYGEDHLIEMLKKIKKQGGIETFTLRSGR